MCAKITQYSRISHHTIAGSASAGLTFSVPAQEDFTDGSWTPYDLALSEIGVNEQDKKVYIRIDDEILEFGLYGSGSSFGVTPSLSQVLQVGNNTGGNNIILDTFDSITDITNASSFAVTSNEALIAGLGVNILAYGTNSNTTLLTDVARIRSAASGIPDSSDFVLGLSSSYWYTSDGTLYDNRITFNQTDMLFKADDISNIKYGELQLTHTVTYFSHYNNGLLSYIQAQDNTIDIQTQGSGALNKVNLDSATETIGIISLASGGEFSSIDIVSTATPSIILKADAQISVTEFGVISIKQDEILLNIDNANVTPNIKMYYDNTLTSEGAIDIDAGAGRIKFKNFFEGVVYDNTLVTSDGNVYNQHEISTTNSTPAVLSVAPGSPTINFGVTNSVITIEAVVNGWGATNSKAYGAKLFGTFKNAGGTVTQLSTTDKSEKTDFSTATSDFNISGTDINIRVTGEALTDINWVSRFNYQISK